MTGIDASELASMRADLEQLLPDTCNIITVTYTPDGYGGVTPTLGTIGTAVPCRLDYKRGVEVLTGGAIQSYSGWMLTLPYSATISTENRVELGAKVYSVTGEDTDKSWPVCVRVPVVQA